MKYSRHRRGSEQRFVIARNERLPIFPYTLQSVLCRRPAKRSLPTAQKRKKTFGDAESLFSLFSRGETITPQGTRRFLCAPLWHALNNFEKPVPFGTRSFSFSRRPAKCPLPSAQKRPSAMPKVFSRCSVGVRRFERPTTRPPDAYSNRAELHPELFLRLRLRRKPYLRFRTAKIAIKSKFKLPNAKFLYLWFDLQNTLPYIEYI